MTAQARLSHFNYKHGVENQFLHRSGSIVENDLCNRQEILRSQSTAGCEVSTGRATITISGSAVDWFRAIDVRTRHLVIEAIQIGREPLPFERLIIQHIART
jgi:hypothetical protein